MPKTVKVKLENPILDHGGNKTEVVLREPRGIDFVELGEPFSYARADKGLVVHAENDVAIKGYLERCVVEPDWQIVWGQATLLDMIQIKDALFGFFASARQARLPNIELLVVDLKWVDAARAGDLKSY